MILILKYIFFVWTYIHKGFRQFHSKREVKLFVELKGIEKDIFKGRNLRNKATILPEKIIPQKYITCHLF
jgi:hypothetical protein